MKIALLKLLRILYIKSTWLKCTNASCYDDGMCVVNLFICRDNKMTLILFLDSEHFLFKTNIRTKALELLIQIINQLLSGDLREAGYIVNIFLRV
ncbi:hypothetical protein D3C71_1724070 [compost metagenome]